MEGSTVLIERSRAKAGGTQLLVIGLLIPVATGRWGSYIGLPGTPMFLSDILVLIGILALLRASARGTVNRCPDDALRIPNILIVGGGTFLAIVGLAVLLTSSADKSLVVRDAAPFVYFALTPLAYLAIAKVGLQRVKKFLLVGCITHTVWCTPVIVGLIPVLHIGGPFGRPIFESRGDYDLLISGLSVAVFLSDRSLKLIPRILLVGAAGTGLLVGGSRAGLISGVVVIVLSMVLVRQRRRVSPQIIGTLCLGAVTLSLVAMWFVNDPPSWTGALTRIFAEGSGAQISADNTWEARTFAWQRIAEYTLSDSFRAMWGTGLGGQPLIDSGAISYLSGNTSVRAAHNFVFTWMAMFGVIGLTILLAIILTWLTACVKNAYRLRGVRGFSAAFAVGIVLASLGGVILESPFGYMPFVFAVALSMQPLTRTSDDVGSS